MDVSARMDRLTCQVDLLVAGFEKSKAAPYFQEPLSIALLALRNSWADYAEFYADFLSKHSANHIAWHNLGEALELLHLESHAKKVYDVSACILQNYFKAGYKAFLRNDFLVAFDCFMLVDPCNRKVNNYLGYCCMKLKWWEQACQFFKSALEHPSLRKDRKADDEDLHNLIDASKYMLKLEIKKGTYRLPPNEILIAIKNREIEEQEEVIEAGCI